MGRLVRTAAPAVSVLVGRVADVSHGRHSGREERFKVLTVLVMGIVVGVFLGMGAEALSLGLQETLPDFRSQTHDFQIGYVEGMITELENIAGSYQVQRDLSPGFDPGTGKNRLESIAQDQGSYNGSPRKARSASK